MSSVKPRAHGLHRGAATQIVGAELDNGDVGVRPDRLVETQQCVGEGAAVDAGIGHDDVMAFLAQRRLQLRRIGVLVRHQPAGGHAVAEGDDMDGTRRCRDGRSD